MINLITKYNNTIIFILVITILYLIFKNCIFNNFKKKETFITDNKGYFNINEIQRITSVEIIDKKNINTFELPIGTIIPYYPLNDNNLTNNKLSLNKITIESLMDKGFFVCDNSIFNFTSETSDNIIRNNNNDIIGTYTYLNFNGSITDQNKLLLIYDNQNKLIAKIPDLRKHFIVGAGSNPFLTESLDKDDYKLGKMGGEDKHKLTIDEMPSHNHEIQSNSDGTKTNWTGYLASGTSGFKGTDRTHPNKYNVGNVYILNKGGNQPHENRPPFVAMYYIIYTGILPLNIKEGLKLLIKQDL